MNTISRYEKIVHLLAADPAAAADELDRLADDLRAQAQQLREAVAPTAPTDRGGVKDRCRMRVVGPDGAVKQETDTGA